MQSRIPGRCRSSRSLKPPTRAEAAPRFEALEGRTLFSAWTLHTLVNFTGSNGAGPTPTLTADPSGNVYGTTQYGGAYNDGTVFEIAQGSNSVTTLGSFNSANKGGFMPETGVAVDAAGDVFGTTFVGGHYNHGTVFEVRSGSNVITTLVSLSSESGANAPLTVDASGNVYGTMRGIGAIVTSGSVFEIAAGSSTLKVLACFNGLNGEFPESPLLIDASGNLYGTTYRGGPSAYGTVFEVPNNSGTIIDLASFNRANGSYPEGQLAMDSQANIYGKASDYGTAPGVTGGMIFEVVKGSGQITTLAHVSYDGDGVTMDAAGNLYTVEFNGDTGLDFDVASVVELPKGSRTLKTLVSMNASNWVPTSSLALDAAGNLYGSTGVSSPHGGTVFELTPNTSLSIKLTGGTNPSPTNAQLTYTATLTGGVPDGQSVLLEDASDNDAILATGIITDGSATLTVLANTLSVGTHDLIAVYGGDANHATSVSIPIAQIVTASTARTSRQP
jgi:uncharacterized repeat protein (TIGR03803 family)